VTTNIPVVALSANAVPRDIAKGLKAGFFRYLTKPLKVDEFMETLDVALAFADKGPAHDQRRGDGDEGRV
jgi:CheY-like chemotaxis protein